jgi:hypothetical protein
MELPLNNYQSIDTATSYATDGFTKYLRYNGTNSSLASVAGGGGDAGMLFSQVIECRGGAGTVRKIFRDAGANTGYTVCINAANKLELSVGDGLTNTAIATAGTLAIGVKYLVTAWDDGVNLNVQIDSGAIASVTRPAVVSGTTSFTLGASLGGTSNWLPADTNAIVYLAAAPTAAQVSSAQIYCKTKAGL